MTDFGSVAACTCATLLMHATPSGRACVTHMSDRLREVDSMAILDSRFWSQAHKTQAGRSLRHLTDLVQRVDITEIHIDQATFYKCTPFIDHDLKVVLIEQPAWIGRSEQPSMTP
jgi:hypothetical protein